MTDLTGWKFQLGHTDAPWHDVVAMTPGGVIAAVEGGVARKFYTWEELADGTHDWLAPA